MNYKIGGFSTILHVSYSIIPHLKNTIYGLI